MSKNNFYLSRAPSFSPYSSSGSTEPDMRKEFINTLEGFYPEISKGQIGLLRRMNRDSNDQLTVCSCVDLVTKEPDKDRFCSVCVKRDSQIPTLHGVKKIQDIIPGEYVLTGSGNYCLVTNINGKLNTKGMVSIISKGRNNIPTEVTFDHLIAIFRPEILCHQKKSLDKTCITKLCGAYSCVNKTEEKTSIPTIRWIRADLVQIGDYVVCPIQNQQDASSSTIIVLDSERFLSKKGARPKIPSRNIIIDPDLMFFLGMYAAEGSGDAPSRKSRTVVFTLHENEIDIAKRLLSISLDKFNLEGTIKYKNQSKLINVEIPNAILSRWMHFLCGRYSDNKYIPEFIWSLDRNLQSDFIKAFMLGDGHRNSQNWETAGIVSRRLAEEIYILALQLGYNPSISYRPAYESKDQQFHSDSWLVSWLDSLQESSRTQPTKWRDRFIWDNKIFSRVTEVLKKEDTVAVYDLTVDDDHSFIANGILVHNCYSEGFLWHEEPILIYRVLLNSNEINATLNKAGGIGPAGEYRSPGLINAPLVVFYIRYDTNITIKDKIVRLVLDTEGNPVIPRKRQGIYRINNAWDYRADNGKLEYWKVFTHFEDVKYLNIPRYEEV